MVAASRLILICLFAVLVSSNGYAIEASTLPKDVVLEGSVAKKKHELLIKIKSSLSAKKAAKLHKSLNAKVAKTYAHPSNLQLVVLPEGLNLGQAIEVYSNNELVEYAEPNYYYQVSDLPNDPEFPRQWALNNDGQDNGVAGADIRALEAWELTTGSDDFVLGVIDTGVLYTHPDLAQNIWSNPLEIPDNGIDDDNNGFVDDVHGINAITMTGDPLDDHGHGTHVAGTIGASTNNGLGVSGVMHKASIVGCKFLSASGGGSASDAITCLNYFASLKTRDDQPVRVVATNNSWGGGGFSQALKDAIESNEKEGILFVAAAGNDSRDNDVGETYPANYKLSNIISVAATDRKDELAYFSNYGDQMVHVAAPGVKILSTFLSDGYRELSGTSMAAPHVTGLVGLIHAGRPDLDFRGIRNLVITGGQEVDSVSDKTISKRRIVAAGLDGLGSLTCVNQTVTKRLSPKGSSFTMPVGESVEFAIMNLNCEYPAGAPLLSDAKLGLKDDGSDGDHLADDGVYSSVFSPDHGGAYAFDFGNGDVVNVSVFDPSSWYEYAAQDEEKFEYRNIGGTKLSLSDDSAQTINTPFPIHFAGDEAGFSSITIGSNGVLSFTDTELSSYQNSELPNENVQTFVSPYWDDLNPRGGGVYFDVVGEAPNRELVVDYREVSLFSGTGTGSFQVVFFENSGDILFNYLDVEFGKGNGHGDSATVGVQISNKNATQYSFNEANLDNESAIRFSSN